MYKALCICVCERERVCVCLSLILHLWDPMDCSPPGSSVHGILQSRIQEWVAIPFSKGSSWLGIKPGSTALPADFSLFDPQGKPIQGIAAAKSLQSSPTLCNPMDGSPPGSPIPGILQARTLQWVAISFSNAWKWKVKVKSLSRVQL